MSAAFLQLLVSVFALSAVATFAAHRVLPQFGLLDRPDERRKLHKQEIAVGGGIAVYLALAAGLLVVTGWPTTVASSLLEARPGALGYLPAFVLVAGVLVGFGLVDDRVGLRGRQKLLVQLVVATAAVWGCDLAIEGVQVFGREVYFGKIGFVLAVLWLVGAINAINLLDGADGVASVVGITIAGGLAGLAIATGRPVDAILPALLAASLLGFLPMNFPPARIFLGDTGSQLIGLTLGVAAMRASLKGTATVALTAVVAIWFIPLLDVGVAIVRRKLAGRSIYVTDRGHLHHRLAAKGFAGRRLLGVVGLMCGITAVAGVACVYYQTELLAVGTIAIVLLVLIATKAFAHSEARLVVTKTSNFAKSMVQPRNAQPRPREQKTQLQGVGDWETIWSRLLDYARYADLAAVRLEIHAPALGEDFVARWARESVTEPERLWRSDIPIATERGVVGRIEIRGLSSGTNASARVIEQMREVQAIEAIVLANLTPSLGWDEPPSPIATDGYFTPEVVAKTVETNPMRPRPVGVFPAAAVEKAEQSVSNRPR